MQEGTPPFPAPDTPIPRGLTIGVVSATGGMSRPMIIVATVTGGSVGFEISDAHPSQGQTRREGPRSCKSNASLVFVPTATTTCDRILDDDNLLHNPCLCIRLP